MIQAAFEPGYVIAGRYRVIGRLGAGGMGTVYEAEQLELGRAVAVKVLHPNITADQSMSARFLREARAAAQIGHPGIVQVFDLGTDGVAPFLVMEKLEGEELGTTIAQGNPLPVDWVVSMGIELCDALQAAHDHGIVHRDLKPPNVFLARQGRRTDVVKVLDFGIAKLIQRADEIETKTGQVFGTPMYMAPEQLRDSKDVDGRADVYAIGCILFQALVGHPPFEATTYPDLIFRVCSAPRPRAHHLRGDVPRALGDLLARALALDVAERPGSPAELAQALGAPFTGSRTRASEHAAAVGSAATEVAHVVAVTPASQGVTARPTRGRGVVFALAGALGTLGLATFALSSARPQPEQEPQRTPATPVTPVASSTVSALPTHPRKSPGPESSSSADTFASSKAPSRAPALASNRPVGARVRSPASARVPSETPPPLIAP
jgi:serine/threonine protein kinase